MRCFYRKVARAAGSRPAPRPLSAPPPPVPLRPAPPNPPRLPRPRRAQPDQFQQREEGHDQLGAGALAPDHRREEERPGVAEEGEDLAHALEDGERGRLPLAGRLAPRPRAWPRASSPSRSASSLRSSSPSSSSVSSWLSSGGSRSLDLR